MCLSSATAIRRADDVFVIGSGSSGDIRTALVTAECRACCHVVPLQRPAVFIAGRLRPCRCSPSCLRPPAEARSCDADKLQLWRVVCCHDLAATIAEEVEGRQWPCEGLSMGSAAGRAAIRPVIDKGKSMPCTSSSPFIATLVSRALPRRALRPMPDPLTPEGLPASTESRHHASGNVLRPTAFL